MSDLPHTAHIVEVGPRDGLQNEPAILPIENKLEFIRLLGKAGLTDIELASFVHPKWIPQLADSEELIALLPKVPGIRYSALVPNMQGLFDRLGIVTGVSMDRLREAARYIGNELRTA